MFYLKALDRESGIELSRTKKVYNYICRLRKNSWQGFVCRNQTSTEEILISDGELSRIEDEIREIRELLDD